VINSNIKNKALDVQEVSWGGNAHLTGSWIKGNFYKSLNIKMEFIIHKISGKQKFTGNVEETTFFNVVLPFAKRLHIVDFKGHS
jgi:hypothetical protein